MIPQPSRDFLILAGDLTDEAIGDTIGHLAVGLVDPVATGSFALLDSFDQSIRGRGRVLIETEEVLALYHDWGAITQDSRRSGSWVHNLASGPVRDALEELFPTRRLLSVGTGTISRRRLVLTDDEGKTQARAELVTLRPRSKGRPVTLTSLQGLRGYHNALQLLRERVNRAAMPSLNGITDLVDVLFPEDEPHVATPDVQINLADTVFCAANKFISAYLDVAHRNQTGIVADHDTGFLNDYCVALCKISSVISLFDGIYSDKQTAALKTSFSELMAPTGRLRNLDVYLFGREDYHSMLPETLHEGLTLMFRIFAEERQREHKTIVTWFHDARYRASIAMLEARFRRGTGLAKGPVADRPVQGYACALIWTCYRNICKMASAITADTPDEQVDELRILCKKLRDLMELVAPVLPMNELGLLLRPLKGLQDNLGRFNDYSVQQVALQDFMNRRLSGSRKQDLMLAQSIGALIAVLHARQKEERTKVMSSFSKLDSPGIRSNFRDLFHGKEI
ncbi:MAG: CHAD domain-containing protein [Alphaproteobacteria bacterium]|nr:CHAD domain-containing protein [Alphaproteobacteria bacterium]